MPRECRLRIAAETGRRARLPTRCASSVPRRRPVADAVLEVRAPQLRHVTDVELVVLVGRVLRVRDRAAVRERDGDVIEDDRAVGLRRDVADDGSRRSSRAATSPACRRAAFHVERRRLDGRAAGTPSASARFERQRDLVAIATRRRRGRASRSDRRGRADRTPSLSEAHVRRAVRQVAVIVVDDERLGVRRRDVRRALHDAVEDLEELVEAGRLRRTSLRAPCGRPTASRR